MVVSWFLGQGLTLAKPEMVPFRLTQNLIDGFGVAGIEGTFRHVCEITLQVSSIADPCRFMPLDRPWCSAILLLVVICEPLNIRSCLSLDLVLQYLRIAL
jgi:hypothetical protein